MKNRFSRPFGTLRCKKMFVIAAEGRKTENQYFGFFCGEGSVVHIRCLQHGDKSAPEHLLKTIERNLAQFDFRAGDEVWCVCDTDNWKEDQLNALFEWSKQKENYGLAVSNPNFEFWLLLHFEDGSKVRTAADCKTRLKRHLQRYDKSIKKSDFPKEKIEEAVARAKRLDAPRCTSWPKDFRRTTVYRLVERILAVS